MKSVVFNNIRIVFTPTRCENCSAFQNITQNNNPNFCFVLLDLCNFFLMKILIILMYSTIKMGSSFFYLNYYIQVCLIEHNIFSLVLLIYAELFISLRCIGVCVQIKDRPMFITFITFAQQSQYFKYTQIISYNKVDIVRFSIIYKLCYFMFTFICELTNIVWYHYCS